MKLKLTGHHLGLTLLLIKARRRSRRHRNTCLSWTDLGLPWKPVCQHPDIDDKCMNLNPIGCLNQTGQCSFRYSKKNSSYSYQTLSTRDRNMASTPTCSSLSTTPVYMRCCLSLVSLDITFCSWHNLNRPLFHDTNIIDTLLLTNTEFVSPLPWIQLRNAIFPWHNWDMPVSLDTTEICPFPLTQLRYTIFSWHNWDMPFSLDTIEICPFPLTQLRYTILPWHNWDMPFILNMTDTSQFPLA